MRTLEGGFKEYELSVESLGGIYGLDPVPVGLVLFTEYKSGAKWNPKIFTAGEWRT